MPLSATRKRIDLPATVDHYELADELEGWLRGREDVRQVDRHEVDESVMVEAETKATLLTWSQEIGVTLESGEALIEVKSPDQWIDWGKSEKTAEEISKLLNDDPRNSGRAPA